MVKMVASPIEIFEFGNPLTIGGPTAVSPHDFALGARIQQLAVEISNELPDEVRASSQLLRSNVRSALLVRNLFTIQPPDSTPSGFVDHGCGTEWWHCANTAAAFSRALDIHLCSYLSENGGNLFVHLVPTDGNDKGALKSRKGLRGHTDASAPSFRALCLRDFASDVRGSAPATR